MSAQRISGVGLSDVFRAKDGSLWKVVGIAERPTVTVELVGQADGLPVARRLRHHLVIGSAQFDEFEQLIPRRERLDIPSLTDEEAERLRADFRRRAE